MFGYEMVFLTFLPILLLSAIIGGLLGAAATLGFLRLRGMWSSAPLPREEARAMAARGSVIGVFLAVLAAVLLIGFNLALHFM